MISQIRATRGPGAVPLCELLFDEGSFTSWDKPLAPPAGMSPEYAETLKRTRQDTGLDEAVITGRGNINGVRIAVVIGEFGFLAGSIGVRTSERIHDAVRRATAEGLPLVALPISGGTRMQEGTGAFAQMIKITAAVEDHKAAGLVYLVYLRNPTTGGVLASWGSLGHVTAAEPGALVGFLGPKVFLALTGEEFPSGIQTAENLFRNGIIDAVVDHSQLRGWVESILGVLSKSPGSIRSGLANKGVGGLSMADKVTGTGITHEPWQSVLETRASHRPRPLDVTAAAASKLVFLNGDGRGTTGQGLFISLAKVGGYPCVLMGHQDSSDGLSSLKPGCLRVAQRAMELAEQLRLPLVSLIDTPGAELSVAAEESGLAGEIARTLARLVRIKTATLSVLLGRGTGGGALAMLPADRTLAVSHAWLGPLPPEGASTILYKTTSNAPTIAREQGISASDLQRDGVVDRVIDESDGNAETFCSDIARAIVEELAHLHELLHGNHEFGDRRDRFGAIGTAKSFN